MYQYIKSFIKTDQSFKINFVIKVTRFLRGTFADKKNQIKSVKFDEKILPF